MQKTILTLFLAFWISAIFAQNSATSPKIISTNPAFGDCNVDPGLNEIIIKFDQDMGNGMSVLNTPNMPQNNGQPKWIDKRTFSIPVKLYPGKLYSLAFNNSRFQGFASSSGIPLNPEVLYFNTKAVSYGALNKKSYNEFITFFPKEYSYASLKGIDWNTVIEKNRSDLKNAATNTEFALKLINILRKAEDPHLWVEVERQRLETGNMRLVETNSGFKQILPKLQDLKLTNDFRVVAGVIDSTGYIFIHDWTADLNKLKFKSANSKNSEIDAEDVLKDLFKYKNLIVDVRENSGGDERYAKNFASYFARDSVPYEKIKYYNSKSGTFDNEHLKMLYPNKKLNYGGNIYVLSGPAVMSSNESFILMMKQLTNAKVVGMKTYGSSGNPLPHELSNGVKIYLPSWQAYTLDGILLEGNGIKPDIEIITTKKDFEKKDPLVEQVIKLIKEKK